MGTTSSITYTLPNLSGYVIDDSTCILDPDFNNVNLKQNNMTDFVDRMKVERDDLADKIVKDVTFLCSVESVRLSESDFEELKRQLVAMLDYHEYLVKRLRRHNSRRGDS